MASIISAGTTSGTSLNLSADTSGVLQLATNGTTTAMTITTAQNVGIGTTSPGAKLENTGSFRSTGVTDPTSGAGLELCYRGTVADVLSYNRDTAQFTELQVRGSPVTFLNAGGERMRITSSGDVGIGTTTIGAALTVAKSNTYAGGLLLGQAAVASGYLWTTDNLYIKPNTSANTASGSVFIQNFAGSANQISLSAVNGLIAIGGAAVPASGVGITFPATQSASSDANTLDDYEEGTWTPNVGGNATYTIQKGTYVKVGKLVTVNFDMAINTIGTGSETSIAGFPFTSSNEGFPRTGCISYYEALSVSPVWVAFYVQTNATTCLFVWNTATSATVGNNGANLLTNNSRIIGSVSYTASA